jgi:DNA-binding response OmpR family regulator
MLATQTRTVRRRRRLVRTCPRPSVVGPPSFDTRPIVLSDDDPSLLSAYAHILTDEGFCNVHKCTDGVETIHVCRTVLPSLVVTDLMKPGLGGEEMAWLMKEDELLRSIKILLASGVEDDYAFDPRLFCAFLPKPFSPREFVTTVRGVLSG